MEWSLAVCSKSSPSHPLAPVSADFSSTAISVPAAEPQTPNKVFHSLSQIILNFSMYMLGRKVALEQDVSIGAIVNIYLDVPYARFCVLYSWAERN